MNASRTGVDRCPGGVPLRCHVPPCRRGAAPRSVGGCMGLVSRPRGRTTKHRSPRSLRVLKPRGIDLAFYWDRRRPRSPETLHTLGKHKPAETPIRGSPSCGASPTYRVKPPVRVPSDPSRHTALAELRTRHHGVFAVSACTCSQFRIQRRLRAPDYLPARIYI